MHRLQWWQGTYAEARMSLVYVEECKAETQVREVKQSKYAKEESAQLGQMLRAPARKAMNLARESHSSDLKRVV